MAVSAGGGTHTEVSCERPRLPRRAQAALRRRAASIVALPNSRGKTGAQEHFRARRGAKIKVKANLEVKAKLKSPH